MSEARKLDNSGLPEIPVNGAQPPRRDGPVPIRAQDERLPPLPAAGPSPDAAAPRRKAVPDGGRPAPGVHEPSLGEAELATSGAPERPARAPQKKKRKKGGVGRALLILFLVGFVSFAGTAGLTAGIVLGNFDMKSGKVKEAVQGVKVFFQQLRN